MMTFAGWNSAAEPLLILNLTASMPVGIYRLVPDAPTRRRDIVVIRLPRSVAAYAAERGYLIAGRPALKHVAAVGGDRVCRLDAFVSINGRLAAVAYSRDRAGRPLPRWSGCRHLRADELFTLGTAAGSFDGRYFGIVPRAAIVGGARPLWTIRN